jgi:hypothetical protein
LQRQQAKQQIALAGINDHDAFPGAWGYFRSKLEFRLLSAYLTLGAGPSRNSALPQLSIPLNLIAKPAVGGLPERKEAALTEKTDKLITEALRKAAVNRCGIAPFVARNEPGLFPASAAGRQAAEQALNEGLFEAARELWTITAMGFAMLLERTSFRQVLEDCVRALESRQDQVADLQSTLGVMCAHLEGLRATIEQLLPASGQKSLVATEINGDRVILEGIGRWQADSVEDCPLPELFRQIEFAELGLSIGDFHDALRRLHAAQRIQLHPWTGPLYRMPEPTFALLIGHEVVYYASGRSAPSRPDYSTKDGLAAARA